MNRIDSRLAVLREEKRKAFIPFLTAGDPDLDTTMRILQKAESAGADIVELGFPFSDPIADGPTIQASYARVLENGGSSKDVFNMVGKLRRTSDIPIVAMISYSLVFRMGFEKFIERALEAGLDGATIPDLPAEEMQKFVPACKEADFNLISFLTPKTSPSRRKKLISLTGGFIYYIAVCGITGERSTIPEGLRTNLLQIKEETDIPLAVGFGISTPEQAREVSAVADGVIVGSAIVRRISESREAGKDPAEEALGFIRQMSDSFSKKGE